ncbi:polysaccharide deacetylase family protein, partial [Candidatus Omnitrophota bacterium]
MKNDRIKKLGTVQIDVDGLWVIFQHFGHERREPRDIMYESAMPRFLDLFDAHGIKATLFVVGRDLLVPTRLKLLKKARERGHEIANHSMNHAEGFSFLPLDKKIKEIAEAERAIQDNLGVTPKGFRTPSNDVDVDVLKILEDRGYTYDSSLLPTYYAPLIKSLKFSALKIPRKDHYLGNPSHGRAPLHPYHPSEKAVWKKGSMKIMEIPITTMPFLRLPFHVSFALAAYSFGLKSALFNAGYALLNMTTLPLNMVFHTNELSDPIYDKKIKRQFGLNLPLEIKKNLCNHVLKTMSLNFNIVTTLEYA